jgi:hypothetical protein
MNQYPHTGDVHSPQEFGFDVTDEGDMKEWAKITGEMAITTSVKLSSLEPRGGVDPSSPTYFSDLGETRGD